MEEAWAQRMGADMEVWAGLIHMVAMVVWALPTEEVMVVMAWAWAWAWVV